MQQESAFCVHLTFAILLPSAVGKPGVTNIAVCLTLFEGRVKSMFNILKKNIARIANAVQVTICLLTVY